MRFIGFLLTILVSLFAFPVIASRFGEELGPPLTGLFIWTADLTVLLLSVWLVFRAGLRNLLGVITLILALLAFLALAVLPVPSGVAFTHGWYWCVPLGILLGACAEFVVVDLYHMLAGP